MTTIATKSAPKEGYLAYLPIAFFGSVMGLAGLSSAWHRAHLEFGAPLWIAQLLGYAAVLDFVALAISYAIKVVTSFDTIFGTSDTSFGPSQSRAPHRSLRQGQNTNVSHKANMEPLMESAQSSHASPARALPSVRHLPIGLFASVMSIAGLSLAWRLATKAYGANIAVSNIIGAVALSLFAILALSYLVKIFRYPALVKDEFSHPIFGNFFGTVGISILLLSSVIGGYSTTAQLVVWSIGASFTLALSGVMISRLLNGNASPTSVVPAWLIAGVGTLDIVVTGGTLAVEWTREVNLLAAAIGGVSALVFFVLIFSRLVHHEPLAGAMRPSKMIMVGPFAVGFIAYVNLVHKVDMFAALLFYFGLFLFVIISCRLLAKPAPFSQAWWAIGFPMAALSNAGFMYSGSIGGKGLGVIAAILLFLLTASVAVLSIRTVHALATGRLLTA